MEYIAIERHFSYVGPHIADICLGHALLDQRPFLLGNHNVQMDSAAALSHCLAIRTRFMM